MAGTAWAVPVVTLGALAPSAAASVLCTGSFCLQGDFCKLPGESQDACDNQPCTKGYRAVAKISSSTIDRVLLYKVTAQGSTTGDIRICGATPCTGCTNTPTQPGYRSLCIPASSTDTTYTVDVCGFTNSQNTTIRIDYSLYRCDTGASIELDKFTEGGAHPC